MTYCDMWIGKLEDPSFDWNHYHGDGNVPFRISPFFPYAPEGHYFSDFFEWLDISRCEYKQTDWGGWVAKVTKKQLLDFIAYRYMRFDEYTDPAKYFLIDGKPIHVNELKRLMEFIEKLSEKKQYALVAAES